MLNKVRDISECPLSHCHGECMHDRDLKKKVHMGGQNGILEFCWGARFEIIETLPVHVMKF